VISHRIKNLLGTNTGGYQGAHQPPLPQNENSNNYYQKTTNDPLTARKASSIFGGDYQNAQSDELMFTNKLGDTGRKKHSVMHLRGDSLDGINKNSSI
jgi:hypothetical protein